jgi:hypothetical protein
MTDREEEDQRRWREQLRFAKYVQMRAWALSAELPDPTYDPKNGWRLDQFAMRFEPALLQLYKNVMGDLYRSPDSREKYHSSRWIEASSELSGKLANYLLNPRFRVEGYQLGAYEPTVVPRPLLEGLIAVVETSELAGRGVAETFRTFEKVRVYELVEKSAAGRKSTYDWPALQHAFDQEKPRIRTPAQLVEWCRAHVKPMPGKQASKDGPDDKTIREAISKYGLVKFLISQE